MKKISSMESSHMSINSYWRLTSLLTISLLMVVITAPTFLAAQTSNGRCELEVTSPDGNSSHYKPEYKNQALPTVQGILQEKGYKILDRTNQPLGIPSPIALTLDLDWNFVLSISTLAIGSGASIKLYYRTRFGQTSLRYETEGSLDVGAHYALDFLESLVKEDIPTCEELRSSSLFQEAKKLAESKASWGKMVLAAKGIGLKVYCDTENLKLEDCIEFIHESDFIDLFSRALANEYNRSSEDDKSYNLRLWNRENNIVKLSNNFGNIEFDPKAKDFADIYDHIREFRNYSIFRREPNSDPYPKLYVNLIQINVNSSLPEIMKYLKDKGG